MKKRSLFISFSLIFVLGSCAMVQSIVKSTFPYTTTVTLPRSSQVGVELSVSGMATSFDQGFTKTGNNADKVSEVRIISAKLLSKDPSDFNIGNLALIKVYMSKADGSDEVLVASRTDITAGVGNSMVLDIDNSHFLDERVREPNVKIRVVYQLRNHIDVDANLHLVLGLGAYPNNN
jgi:hypothetical protein